MLAWGDVLQIVGVSAELIGTMTMSVDLVRTRDDLVDLSGQAQLHDLLPELSGSLIEGEIAETRKVHHQLRDVAMASAAAAARAHRARSILRTWGKRGLALVFLGLTIQLVGTIVTAMGNPCL